MFIAEEPGLFFLSSELSMVLNSEEEENLCVLDYKHCAAPRLPRLRVFIPPAHTGGTDLLAHAFAKRETRSARPIDNLFVILVLFSFRLPRRI